MPQVALPAMMSPQIALSPKDKKDKRRQYKAQKQQFYREQQRDEVQAMRKLIHDLQNERQRLHSRPKSKSLLAWKEVALALKEHTDDALTEREKLKAVRQKHIELVLHFNKWIAQATLDPVGTPPSPKSAYPTSAWSASHFSLARVSLVAHKDARRHGYDWFTQILYHNTDALMQKYQFPTVPASCATHRLADLFLDSSNIDCLNVIARYAMVFDGSLEDVVDLVKQGEIQYKSYTGYTKEDLALKRMTVDYVDPEDLEKISSRMSYVLIKNVGNAKGTSVLYREYNEPDRVVIVGQSVPLDEVFAETMTLSRKSMSWYVFDRLSPTKTLMRNLFIFNHSVSARGEYLPFDEEASRWGCDVSYWPEESKLDVLSCHIANVGTTGISRTDVAMGRVAEALKFRQRVG